MPTSQPPNSTDQGATVLSAGVDFAPPPEVTRFLARALLLYGVPFHYLVPDERMLPQESIRFFYLDPGWISTLIQGATGVGRVGERDTVLDTTLRYRALGQALIDTAEVREKGAACKEPIAKTAIKDADGTETEIKAASWPLTGFLLRSELVDGWQGVEMRAYKEVLTKENEERKDELELAPLRIDRLAPDIMLCIFNGKVMTLTVKQPPEGLHFGLTPEGGGKYQRGILRKVTEAVPSDIVQPGAQIPIGDKDNVQIPKGKKPISVPMREPAGSSRPTRVVRMAKLAEEFAKALDIPKEKFTSAEFGVQMVESPALVMFNGGAKS